MAVQVGPGPPWTDRIGPRPGPILDRPVGPARKFEDIGRSGPHEMKWRSGPVHE